MPFTGNTLPVSTALRNSTEGQKSQDGAILSQFKAE
jgi:hypothetical protein